MNLTIEPSELLAIVGPTGHGKSTLVQLLTRFYDVDGGQMCHLAALCSTICVLPSLMIFKLLVRYPKSGPPYKCVAPVRRASSPTHAGHPNANWSRSSVPHLIPKVAPQRLQEAGKIDCKRKSCSMTV
ncbi:ATP-binding cassette domain-containing protein [Sphingobium sp.]|uniref:ATP-binding cassette domain-containing protein n=1 Tax=Sphingobium sp. TaxID=1912891 RepID=UPI002B9D50CD|nr:ATP-binding cassette domain-containing protein [Sphingobium sp.]HUD91455.1 ATP-binding cassette domain-containing protein [Sphingobium sp.]